MRQLVEATYDAKQNEYHLTLSIDDILHQFTVKARYRTRQDSEKRPIVLGFRPKEIYTFILPSDPAMSALHQALFTLKNTGKIELPIDLDHHESAQAQREALDQHVYVIDGNRFATFEEFYEEIGAVLIPDTWWGRNLDALIASYTGILAHWVRGLSPLYGKTRRNHGRIWVMKP